MAPMNGRMAFSPDGWQDGRTDGWMDIWMDWASEAGNAAIE